MEPSKRSEAEEDKELEDLDICLTYPEKLKMDSEVAPCPSKKTNCFLDLKGIKYFCIDF